MNSTDIVSYLKNTFFSVVMMILITYGMATSNSLLSPLNIILLMMVAQFGYQIIKGARSTKALEANRQDATRAKKGPKLFGALEKDVNEAKEKSKGSGEMSFSTKMLISALAPLAIFLGSGYILSILIPTIQQWQSYLIGFLLSMPVSMFLMIKVGMTPGAMSTTPNSYIVNEKGITFDYLKQSFILRFPLTKINVQKEKHFIEVEAKAEASTIPKKLKLFSENIDQLYKVLAKHVIDQNAQKQKPSA